jgi:hypothetical protein
MTTKAAPQPQQATQTPARSFTPAPVPLLLRKCACGGSTGGECEDCKRKKPMLQRHAAGSAGVGSVPPVVHSVLNSPGHPLDAPTRGFMESRFGHDFSQVRVHTDSEAAESARAVRAHAYTVGQDVVFGAGNYRPHTPEGRHLLAHELAHTVQQRGLQRSASDRSLRAAEDVQLEREAESAASAVAGDGLAAPIAARLSAPALSRAADDAPKLTKEQKQTLKDADFEDMEGPPEGVKGIRRFRVLKPFRVPETKGPVKELWDARAKGGGLESIMDITGEPSSVLKQERPGTDMLRKIWLSKVGWPEGKEADKNWKAAGGDSANFDPPKAGGETCQMDHIIELQVGGTNIKENMQALDGSHNASSGSTIRGYLSGTASALKKAVPELKLKEVILHWDKVEQDSFKCGDCCGVEVKAVAGAKLKQDKAAKDDKVLGSSEGDEVVERYPISAGGSATEILITAKQAAKKKEPVPIRESELAENKSAATLVSGLILDRLHWSGKQDTIDAQIDPSGKSRIPAMTLKKEGRGSAIQLKVSKAGKLSVADATPNVEITYGYLSPGRITHLNIDEAGETAWKGYIAPNIPMLGRLDVAYKSGELSITKGLDPKQLKPPFPGVRIAEASLGLKLAPEFKPEGKLKLLFGTEAKPLAEAELTASTDGVGFVATGVLRVFIPGVDKAEAEVTYKGGGDYGKGSWTGTIVIESSQIKLPYVESGRVVVQLAPGKGVIVEGEVNLGLPGENKATVGLRREPSAWVFSGGGRFKVPKVGPVNVHVRYNTSTQLLIASAKDVSFEMFGLTAKLHELTAEIKPEQRPVFYGSGGIELKKGKVSGKASITLNRNGKFTAKGVVTYQFNENLAATAGVELDEKERLKFSGKLTITYFKLFKEFGSTKELFSLDISIPIPGASIGGIGLEARIGGGVKAGYQIGPGSIAPLYFAADFYPLEDNTDLTLEVGGQVNIPAWAKLEAYIYGGVALDVFVAEVGGKLVLTGTIKLDGGLFAPFKATYKAGKIFASLTPEIKAALILGIALDFTAWAKAGIGWLSVKTEKTWNLGRREVNTGLGFSLKAPLEYSTDTGPKLPSIDQIELKKPDITSENLKRILRELVYGSDPKEREV